MRFRKKYSARANGRQSAFLGNIQLYAAVQIGIQRFEFFFLMFLRHMSVGSSRSGWSKGCIRQTTRSFRIVSLPCPAKSDPCSVNLCQVLAYILAYVAYWSDTEKYQRGGRFLNSMQMTSNNTTNTNPYQSTSNYLLNASGLMKCVVISFNKLTPNFVVTLIDDTQSFATS